MKISILNIVGAVLLLLALTNPTEKKLEEHLGKINEYETVSESHDYFICSTYIYKYDGPDRGGHAFVLNLHERVYYFGILGFFIETGRYVLTD